jgi:hypothetical protein
LLATQQNGPFGLAAAKGRVAWSNPGVMTCQPSGACAFPPGSNGSLVVWDGCDASTKTIASGQAAPLGVAMDAKNVYWTNFGDGTVVQAPVGGGAPTVLASGQTFTVTGLDIAVDATSVYWFEFKTGELRKAPIGGGPIATLVAGLTRPYALVIDATGTYAYWTENNPSGAVRRALIATGAVETIASGMLYPQGLAVVGADVAWTQFGGHSLVKAPVNGGAPVVLAQSGSNPWPVATDGASLFWASIGGDIASVPVTGGVPTLLAGGRSLCNSGGGVAYDAGAVSWTENGGGNVVRWLL